MGESTAMTSIILNIKALGLVVVAMSASFIVYRKLKSGKRLVYMAEFSQIIVFCISLFYFAIELTLFDETQLGVILAFVIMTNIYVSLINIGVRLWWLFVVTARKHNNFTFDVCNRK